MKRVHAPDYLKIYSIIERDFWEGDTSDGARVFAFGDLGTDHIDVVSDFESSLTLSFIGWQYSGPGRGMNGDIARLAAQIRAHTFEVDDTENILCYSAEALLSGITTSYRRTSRKNVTNWSVGWDGDVADWGSLHLPGETVCILRSAFVVFGAQLIEAAMSWKSVCSCKKESSKDGCKRRMKFVTEGCWHVGMAGMMTTRSRTTGRRFVNEDLRYFHLYLEIDAGGAVLGHCLAI
ncbi:hypothetical protein DL98DRAFT_658661 [Cadophora sp. DSE1049]|nr:hypothetical protein DL98DRAFT_658661 [Cadophora sp. DSE1049]